MGGDDIFNVQFPTQGRGFVARLKSALRGNVAGRNLSDGALLELSSIDMLVAFYEDRLEFRRRLGSKHGIIPFNDIRAVTLIKKTPIAIRVGDVTTFDTSGAFTKKMVLTGHSRRNQLVFDFRTEPREHVQQALELVARHLHPSS